MTGHKLSKEARKRLDTMVATNDGFVIAEADLEIRGPGDMSGTLQSGLPNLKVANLATDGALLGLARSVAKDLLQRCPKLDSEECNGLKSVLDRQQQSGTPWSLIA
jgi:ATP-dependent DNA helicase RecG